MAYFYQQNKSNDMFENEKKKFFANCKKNNERIDTIPNVHGKAIIEYCLINGPFTS